MRAEVYNARLLTLILALVMSVNMSGCYNKVGVQSGQGTETTADTTVQSETNAKKELKQVTVSEFADNICIEGVHIPFPCTYNELCDCFGSENIYESDVSGLPVDGTDYYKYNYRISLDYLHGPEVNGDFYCGILGFSIITKNRDEIYECYISEINYYPGKEHFEICGLNENSKFDDMVVVLGENYNTKYFHEYEYTEDKLHIILGFGQFDNIYDHDDVTYNNEKNKISHIRIRYDAERQENTVIPNR